METNKVSEFLKLNVNEKTEKKNGLTYLSWAWAWTKTIEADPDATYEVKMFDNKPYIYDENLGYMVMTSVTFDGKTKIMQLPVMNSANKAQKAVAYTYKGIQWVNGQKTEVDKTVDAATMFDINTAIMRCLTKNLAMFGLGLYIYAGEDLPDVETPPLPPQNPPTSPIEPPTAPPTAPPKAPPKPKVTPEQAEAKAKVAIEEADTEEKLEKIKTQVNASTLLGDGAKADLTEMILTKINGFTK